MLITNSFHCSSKEALNDPYDLYIKLSREFVADILNNIVYEIPGKFVFNRYIERSDPMMRFVGDVDNWNTETKLKSIFSSPRTQMIFSEAVLESFRIKVISFSKQVDLEKETLMWAHYAGFDGVRLSFILPPFFNGRMDQYSIEKVKYNKTILRVNSERDIEKALLIKTNNWKYENEYRIVFNEDSSKLGFETECLKEIVFGNMMSDDEKVILIRLCKKFGYECDFFQLEITPTGYKIQKMNKELVNAIAENEHPNYLSKITLY